MSSSAEKRQVFFTNMQLLGFEQRHSMTRIAFNVDMFRVPNKAGFEVVTHFLFNRLNLARAGEEFRDCWPVRDKKGEQGFRKVCYSWLLQISKTEGDAHLPKIVPSVFQSPGGERFCNLMFAFSSYVLISVIKNEHSVKTRDMLHKPVLSPQSLDFAPAMVQGTQCMVIDSRKKFFDRVQTRETLHKTWQKSASDMLSEHRRLSRSIREREAGIKSLLDTHAEKGFRSPVRIDKAGKSLTPANKHGRMFDVNIESVRRAEKVQKVRDLWHTVEGFLASTSTHQEVVSSILSGVIHKYVLNASELNLRVPEMLLRECERELLKRDIGNTYKAGKLDLVSIISLWNLSMHLYLERFEEAETLDLTEQLQDLQAKVHSQNSQLRSSRRFASSLRDELIPELKESVRQLKKRYQDKENYPTFPKSKLGMSFQPFSPPLSFDPNLASTADLEAMKMTFTPEMLPQESTPDAITRIMKSVSRVARPQRLAYADRTNNLSSKDPSGVPQGSNSGLSPLAQGKVLRTRQGPSGDKYVGRDSVTSGFVSQMSPAGFPTDTPTSRQPVVTDQQTRNSSQRVSAQPVRSARGEALGRLHSQMESLSTQGSPIVRKSPIDVLASRIANSIMDERSIDWTFATPGGGVEGADVLEELDESGFVKRDKIARTPNQNSGYTASPRYSFLTGPQAADSENKAVGRNIFTTLLKTDSAVDGVLSETDGEDQIITVQTVESRRSSYSGEEESSSQFSLLADNATVEPCMAAPAIPCHQSLQSTTKPAQISDSIVGFSLRDFVSWTPERQGTAHSPSMWWNTGLRSPHRRSAGKSPMSIGRRIVNDVLDEQPLFVESPAPEPYETLDADLLELLPPDNPFDDLQNSSGFIPARSDVNQRLKFTEQTIPPINQAGAGSHQLSMSMEEIMKRYRDLKRTATTRTAREIEEIDQLPSLPAVPRLLYAAKMRLTLQLSHPYSMPPRRR